MSILVRIVEKHAAPVESPLIVCGNSGYQIRFLFDEEWNAGAAKTARFVYVSGGTVHHIDVVFVGDTVNVPVLSNVYQVRVGVFEGDLRTTTPAVIPCEPSIRCETGAPEDPTPSQYDQIMELLANSGAVTTVPMMTEHVAGIAKVGDNLRIDAAGRLSVDTTDTVAGDNTKPITSAAVNVVVGNIEALLNTI